MLLKKHAHILKREWHKIQSFGPKYPTPDLKDSNNKLVGSIW